MADGYLGKHGWSGRPDDGQPFDPLPGADPPAWRGRTAIGLCEACGELVALVHTWDPAEPWHHEHGRPSDRLTGWITLTPVGREDCRGPAVEAAAGRSGPDRRECRE